MDIYIPNYLLHYRFIHSLFVLKKPQSTVSRVIVLVIISGFFKRGIDSYGIDPHFHLLCLLANGILL